MSITTVIAHLKKLKPVKVNPHPMQAVMAQYDFELVCEMDEQWSYVAHKKQPIWLWYVWQPHLKTVLAYELGVQADETFKRLLSLLQPFNTRLYYTNRRETYRR